MKKIKILIGSLLIAILMTGCASKKNNNITIVGSTAMQPMIEWQQKNSNITLK